MARRPITIEDLYEIRLVADPNISPDGRRVAFVVTTVDRAKDGYTSAIWCADLDRDAEPYRFTFSTGKDSSPRWSPDGSLLAFLSDRSGTTHVHVMYADGGEAWQVTTGKNAASDITWSGDSRQIAYVAKVDPPEDANGAKTSDVRAVTSLVYKLDGEGFWDGRRKHVFLVDARGGEPRALTSGDWTCTQPALSPDGRYLAIVSNRAADRDDTTRTDVWLSDLHSGDCRRVTPEDGNYGAPAWSPDARQLAYIGHPVVPPYGPVTLDDLYVHDVETDEPRGLLQGIDREPGNSIIADARYGIPAQLPIWSADGRRVYTQLSDQGSVHVYSCPLRGKPKELLTGSRDITSFTVARDGTIAFAASTMAQPAEVFVQPPGSAEERRVSAVNDAWLDAIELGSVEEVRYASDPDVEVHGWLLRPPAFNSTSRYPAIIQVHGGPHGMYGTGFFHEMHVLAARGYVVLFTNPRGSTGYGQRFVAGSLGDWGGADYRDVMAGVTCLEALPYVDSSRLGITGGSYGGYMTNWVVTQTDRFRAAVTQRSTCNRISLYGTSDLNATYNDWEFDGSPYDNPELYLARSPLSHVKHVTTPLLILHSENDLRCPISQGEELFVALKKLGKEVELVRFPDESHNLSRSGKPAHRVERLERLCGWFDRHL